MLVGRVVDDQLRDHADPAAMGVFDEPVEVLERAVTRVDVLVVRDVVSIVSERRWIEGQQPYTVDPQALEIRKLLGQAGKVADSVVVAVEERADMDLVDDRVLVPERILLLGGQHQSLGSAGSSASGAGSSTVRMWATRRLGSSRT